MMSDDNLFLISRILKWPNDSAESVERDKSGWMDGRMDGWRDGWTDGETVGWTDGKTNGWSANEGEGIAKVQNYCDDNRDYP